MKKISFYILLLIFIYSCGEKKKADNSSVNQKTIDTSSINQQMADTSTVELKQQRDSVSAKDLTTISITSKENILVKEDRKATYQMKSISELWKQYKDAKTSAAKFISENKLDSIIVYLNIAANAAYELSREDIATWQLNNIGYYSINEFKRKTDYDTRMQKLASLKNLKERALYSEKTKSLFQDYFKILSKAKNFLYKAQLLDRELEPSDRTKSIASNLQFINWVDNYISDSDKINRSRSDK